MPLQHIHIFQGCSAGVENFTDPDGKIVGRAVVIQDKQSLEVWRYPLPLDQAKVLGQQLMGIGEIAVSNGHDLAAEVAASEEFRRESR